ncbi:TPA: DUF551 domain-containing protein, partial [Escherichia coli]
MIEGISNKSLNTACVDGGLLYKVTFTQIDNKDNAFTVIYTSPEMAKKWVDLHRLCDFRVEWGCYEMRCRWHHRGDEKMSTTLEQWLEQQHGKIDVDCGCVSTETLMHWMRVAYEAGNSPVTPDGWISCSERMPDDGQWCVVNTEYGYYVQCWSEGQGWLGDYISIPECDVINWMPLPEPPQE